MTQAMILAAGMGTRLGELSHNLPKPLLPVCNHPLICWATELCVHYGITNIAVNLHHLGNLIQKTLDESAPTAAQIVYSHEQNILGTGGGIKKMASILPRQTTLVINGKIIIDIDLKKLLDFHRNSGALATMVVYPHPHAAKWSPIGVDDKCQITRLLDEKKSGIGTTTDYMFTGIHVLESEFIDAIPNKQCCVIRTAYTDLFRQKASLAAYVHQGYFYEHSTPARLLQGNFNLLDINTIFPAHNKQLCGKDPSAKIHPKAKLLEPFLIGPNCQIKKGARVGPYAILGNNVTVASDVTVQNSIVLNHVELSCNCNREIVTSNCKISVPKTDDPMDEPKYA